MNRTRAHRVEVVTNQEEKRGREASFVSAMVMHTRQSSEPRCYRSPEAVWQGCELAAVAGTDCGFVRSLPFSGLLAGKMGLHGAPINLSKPETIP